MKLKEIIFFVEEDPEGGYTAHAVGDSIFTEGETIPLCQDDCRPPIPVILQIFRPS